MTPISVEARAMQRAIALSALGLATTSPNPPVGCVIIDVHGRIVGEGYHERKGEAHAEVQALTAAGVHAEGATAVVTLEPCNHHGRTPPCRQALIDARIARVVIAMLDPTSRGDGGAARLREAGIAVDVGVLADEAQLVLGPWLKALDEHRPQVTWVCLIDADGIRTVPDGLVTGNPLRHSFDAVLDEAGVVEEGRRGAHGEEAFSIPAVALDDGVEPLLSALYRAGTRLLLLDGGLQLAQPFLDTGVVDRIRLYLTSSAANGTGHVDPRSLSFLPQGFRLERIERLDRVVTVDAIAGGNDY